MTAPQEVEVANGKSVHDYCGVKGSKAQACTERAMLLLGEKHVCVHGGVVCVPRHVCMSVHVPGQMCEFVTHTCVPISAFISTKSSWEEP